MLRRGAPTLLAAAIGLLYVLVAPRTGDLAAHVYRAWLFGQEGFSVWNGQWYAGHHTPAYSVLFPPLAWLLGPWLAGAASAVAAAALFEPLARHRLGERALPGAVLFGAGTGATLFAGRLTFALGVAVGLGALLALQRGRHALAPALAVACSLASPVAGAFLALAGVAVALAEPGGADPAGAGSGASGERADRARQDWRLHAARALRGWPGWTLALAALAPPLLLAAAFPEGGRAPFVFSSFVAVPLLAGPLLLLLPRCERTLRIGTALYIAAALASFLIATPMGGNIVRLGETFGPALALGLLAHRELGRARLLAAGALLIALLAWQWSPAVRDVANTIDNPSTEPAYYEPLLRFLEREDGEGRVEIPFTREHWEAAIVAPRRPIARGWLRSTDIAHNPLFYDDRPLTDEGYERWLGENAVAFVALPDAPLDYSARAEAALVAREPPYLTPRWRSEHWRVYEVRGPHALVVPRGRARMKVRALRTGEVVLDVERPGTALVRVRWSPYWGARGTCVERDGDWTRVHARHAGRVRLVTAFSLKRLFSHGRRCN